MNFQRICYDSGGDVVCMHECTMTPRFSSVASGLVFGRTTVTFVRDTKQTIVKAGAIASIQLIGDFDDFDDTNYDSVTYTDIDLVVDLTDLPDVADNVPDDL
jgi:hypothetical protein